MMSHTSVRELSEVSDEHFLDEDRISSGHCRPCTTEIPVSEGNEVGLSSYCSMHR